MTHIRTDQKLTMGFDIGGTTFSSSLYDDAMNRISTSPKMEISRFSQADELINAIAEQIRQLLLDFEVKTDRILGVGASCPGPLDAEKGLILDTPNLVLFRQFPIAEKLSEALGMPVVIENDANLFAMGEWVALQDRNPRVLIGITLGSGTGFGLVLNGELFTGAHGMGAEYGISPVAWGRWEEGISIRSLKKLAMEQLGSSHSPAEISRLAEKGNSAALDIWRTYGERVGLFLSHAVNMLDPDIITIGGGISNAFRFFEKSMCAKLEQFAPAFSYYGIHIIESTGKEFSSMSGAAMLAKKRIGNSK